MQVWMYIYGLKNVKVAIEASTNYSYIVDALAKEGYEVLVAHPLRTRAIADGKIAYKTGGLYTGVEFENFKNKKYLMHNQKGMEILQLKIG